MLYLGGETVYENGEVHIDHPRLLLSTGLVGRVAFLPRNRAKQPRKVFVNDLHVELRFNPCLGPSYTFPDDVVHIYAVEFKVEVCELVASVEWQAGNATFSVFGQSVVKLRNVNLVC